MKDTDSSYSQTCLQHPIEIYDFVDKFREAYSSSFPQAAGFYTSSSGYTDKLVWGAACLLRATGEEKYREMFDKIQKLNMESKIQKDIMEIQAPYLGMIKDLVHMH